jgi:hypothetical protein
MDRSLYKDLVPDPPLHRRTEADPPNIEMLLRRESVRLWRQETAIPGMQEPALVSSYAGAIRRILFCFPAYAVYEPELVAGYRSVIDSLRVGTRFVVVHSASVADQVRDWFTSAGHAEESVKYVPLPDYVVLTDWAEDGYVAAQDVADDSTYLIEPWQFPRGGDALIADAVGDALDIHTQQAPLIFQGGNCLIGDDFWFLGTDYFVDTLGLLQGDRPPVSRSTGESLSEFALRMFREYVDRERRLMLVGTRREIPAPPYRGHRDKTGYFLDIPFEGVGSYQPIFHIDMFVTLLGRNDAGSFEVMVGSPRVADEVLGTTSPWAMPEVYDAIAASLSDQGFVVHRNPLVHWPTVTRDLTLAELMDIVKDDEDARFAIDELKKLEARPEDRVRVRRWHHITWNNCLVENDGASGRTVYMPTFGHGDKSALAALDKHMEDIWHERNFEVKPLADFNAFADRQGVVHCIKKYLERG